MARKILFLSPLPPPYYGSAMSSKECLEILKKDKNFEVKNIKINFAKDISDLGKSKIKKFVLVLKKRKEIESLMKSENFDLIYMMPATSKIGLFKDFLFFLSIKKHFRDNQKIILHIRTRITREDKKNPLRRFIYKKMFRGNSVIVLDDSLKKDVIDFANENSIYVLPNAIKNEVSEKDLNKVIKKRKKQKDFNILFISNMEKSKGWQKLLKACNILNNKKISFRCFFVGSWISDKEKKYFYEYIEKNKLENKVFYLGRKTGKEKKEVFEISNVLVFPTEYKLETFGRVIIEAMMFGMPVIANGIASIPNTIKHNKTGFVLKENSPEEIAKYLEHLYENKNKGIEMGVKGRKRFLNNYEIKGYSIRFKRIISEVLKG